jgi:hypothetical protein
MKTKKELMAEIKWELAVGKYNPYYLEYLALGKEFRAAMSLRDYFTIKYGSWPEDLDEDTFNGTRQRLKEEKQEVWEELAQGHSHVEEHASSHDEKVSEEKDQAVVHDETVDTGMLMGFVTGTDDEGATHCPTYDDYEVDDTTTTLCTISVVI